MRKILLLVFFCLCLAEVSAQTRESEDPVKKLEWDDQMLNIMMDMRFDLQNEFSGDKLENRSFYGDLLKVWFTGSITPNIRYRVRQRLNKAQDPNSRDGLSGATDQAWIAFDVERWTFTVGKQSVQFGTFEYDYSSADVFQPTMIYSDLDSAEIGLNVSYAFKKQVVNFQVVNSGSTQFASEAYKNKALAYNFLWQGDLFKGVVKTRWGFGVFQHDEHKYYNWITLGQQININKFTTELDYYHGYRNMDYSSIVDVSTSALSYVRDEAASVNLKYNFGKFRPFVKGTWGKRFDKDLSEAVYNKYGIEGVVECYPFSNKLIKDLRFHAAYSFSSTSFEGKYADLANLKEHKVLVGLRWFFKVK